MLSQIGDVFGQLIDIDDMRIEVVCEPFFELAVAPVVRIGEGLEEFAIAPGPPTSSGGQWPLASIKLG